VKKHKPWFDEVCSKLLDQRKQAKLQWLRDPSEINGDNLNNIRRETRKHFRNKKREYLKDKIDELATNSLHYSLFKKDTSPTAVSQTQSVNMLEFHLKGQPFFWKTDV
jgi:hypothetical protein